MDHIPLELENQLVLMGLRSWISDVGGKSTSTRVPAMCQALYWALYFHDKLILQMRKPCFRAQRVCSRPFQLEWIMCTEFSVPLAPVVPGLEYPASYLLRRTEPHQLTLECLGHRMELLLVHIQGQPLLLCPLTLTALEGKSWLDNRDNFMSLIMAKGRESLERNHSQD